MHTDCRALNVLTLYCAFPAQDSPSELASLKPGRNVSGGNKSTPRLGVMRKKGAAVIVDGSLVLEEEEEANVVNGNSEERTRSKRWESLGSCSFEPSFCLQLDPIFQPEIP